MCRLEVEEEVFKAFRKLSKRDRKQLQAVGKKVHQLAWDLCEL